MHKNIKILFFAGSLRKDSYNKKLAKIAFDLAKNNVDATFIDLKDYPMPMYDGDFEAENGLPENALKLKEMFIQTHGIFIAAPEYNSSITPLLKNTLDWISRPSSKDEKPLIAFDEKVFALCAASPGSLGGLRGLVPLRLMLSNIKSLVIPNQLTISKANEAFDENGNLKDKDKLLQLQNVLDQLIEFSSKV